MLIFALACRKKSFVISILVIWFRSVNEIQHFNIFEETIGLTVILQTSHAIMYLQHFLEMAVNE